jgi:hypothetical protein
MFGRALLAFLTLPGIVAGLIPGVLVLADPQPGRGLAPGFCLLGAGVVLLLSCVRDFSVAGRGTLAPWAPPQRLVVVGLYRYMRTRCMSRC